MAKIPYFPFYASDWLGSRKRLLMTDAQRGIYIDLLAHQWSDPSGSIPTERILLQKMLPGSKWKNIEYVLRECFVVEGTQGERARNDRLNVEQTLAIGKSYKAKESYKHTKRYKKQQSNDNQTVNRTIIYSEPEPEPDKNIGRSRAVFVPPTVEEVALYTQEHAPSVDPESFVNFYESKGWMIGKNKMKSWKAAVRTWMRNSTPSTPRSGSTGSREGFA